MATLQLPEVVRAHLRSTERDTIDDVRQDLPRERPDDDLGEILPGEILSRG